MCLSAEGWSITSMTTPTMLKDEYEGILLQCVATGTPAVTASGQATNQYCLHTVWRAVE